MKHSTRRGIVLTIVTTGLLSFPLASTVSAAGPQRLPEQACNAGTERAAENAPNQTSAEAMPHIEHAFPVPVPYCHHFNPNAEPPTGSLI